MKRFFDEEYKMHAMSRDDVNVYTLGKIGKHFVTMATPSDTGLTSAATLATDAWRTFKKLRFTLLVGIAAGIPLRGRGIELGDVVVGKRICQYDWKRELGNGKYELIGHLNNPPATLSQIAKRAPEEEAHVFVTNLLRKELATEEFKRPTIHYGVIASGNSLVRDANFRDQILEKERDALCIEMEGAGLTNKHHCLAIRGISDFGDEHKDDIWQRRAARAAAAVATYILSECPPFDDDSPREEQRWWSLNPRTHNRLICLCSHMHNPDSQQALVIANMISMSRALNPLPGLGTGHGPPLGLFLIRVAITLFPIHSHNNVWPSKAARN
ncbi:hypothetical protein TWF788_011056 [Orbilia oligospora]|uniref:Nucleoside phosphorylase domain-containing protein n=1 Tax=Orbilia oligospora TaxID=2813651 RepID=A0A7C8P6F7_ORBOL|nr:hypothetical protein TWF788_011056 [Orbilia oligospora]